MNSVVYYLHKKRWLGHILRHNSLVKLILQIKVAGKRVGGKRRIAILDDVENGVSYALPKQYAQDRRVWRDKLAVPGGTCYTAEHHQASI